MLFAVICKDKPGALQTRLDNRPAHLDYLAGSGVVTMAGPFIEEDKPTGSLVIIDVADRAAAEAWAAGDPYAIAGLFESTTVSAWRKVIG